MFENLSDRLERSFKILKGEGKITEINVAETLKDVRRALLDADVNYKVAKSFTDDVKAQSIGHERADRRQARPAHGEDCPRRAGRAHGWRDCRHQTDQQARHHPDERSARFG